MSDGGFKRQAVLGWLAENMTWKNVGNPPRLVPYELNGRKITENHRDTIERWLANDERQVIPLGRFDEVLLTYDVMLWEFELDYPNAYVPGDGTTDPSDS